MKEIWDFFSRFSFEEQGKLLHSAGVKPHADPADRQHQVMIVWYHGSIPNYINLDVLKAIKRMADEMGCWVNVYSGLYSKSQYYISLGYASKKLAIDALYSPKAKSIRDRYIITVNIKLPDGKG